MVGMIHIVGLPYNSGHLGCDIGFLQTISSQTPVALYGPCHLSAFGLRHMSWGVQEIFDNIDPLII